MQTKLRDKTLELLKKRERGVEMDHIASATGLSVTWLKSFQSKGHKLDSGVNKVETLYEYLTKTTLLV